ncbi:peptidase [Burkholderia sp. WAC0059]|uniref:D-alanyl-D-alanine carboxypeptidase family protein n=1 Tax=Burkholderia sp. WAC0059 TaxID=2066022 RepID=UPI000C7EF627|nr:D-alanyl-D-alanine carboxypeptidase family protein [Burkholderia sp. WAC0059]PLZ02027.1 peptidase [Burkholderia sp. WAC0059]
MRLTPFRPAFRTSSACAVLRRAALLCATLFATVPAAHAQAAPPSVLARSWVLMDATSDQVLASGNANARAEPASLTKLMTAYLVFQALQEKKISMDQTVLPGDAVRTVGNDQSRMFIEAGKPVSVHDLVYGLIVQSGNDAAIALAELVAGSQANFVDMMNAEAHRLGMTGTHFADVNGMPNPEHYTTAGDLAVLTDHLIHDFPEYYPIFSVKEFTYDNIRQPNRNRLLWLDPTVDGLKTGHTEAAGYCLIASALRPVPDAPDAKRRIISVVMGEPTEPDRVSDSMKLLDFGYRAFAETRVYQVGQAVRTVRVYKGTSLSVGIGVAHDLMVMLPSGAADEAKPVVTVTSPLIAPLAAGQTVGNVQLVSQGKVLAEAPLVTLQAVPQANLPSRLWDSMLLMFASPKA